MNTPLHTLKGVGLAGLETAINTALKLDPASRTKLGELEGDIFHIECTSPKIDIFLLPGADGVQLAMQWEGDVTAGLSGTRDDYLDLLHSNDAAATLINGNMRVIGDTGALLKLRDIAASLDLDWEAPLTRVFGDIVGHQMARSLRFGSQLFFDAAKSLQRQVRDYMQEENPFLAKRWQFEQFKRDVVDIETRTAQLVERVEQLRQRIAATIKRQS
ncbi:MAG: SCP2 sterol-binding domain-containing protein [Spongiibacteraceae bacterium]